jgi:hypothetical protein
MSSKEYADTMISTSGPWSSDKMPAVNRGPMWQLGPDTWPGLGENMAIRHIGPARSVFLMSEAIFLEENLPETYVRTLGETYLVSFCWVSRLALVKSGRMKEHVARSQRARM